MTAKLAERDGEFEYHIKHLKELHERIARESELSGTSLPNVIRLPFIGLLDFAGHTFEVLTHLTFEDALAVIAPVRHHACQAHIPAAHGAWTPRDWVLGSRGKQCFFLGHDAGSPLEPYAGMSCRRASRCCRKPITLSRTCALKRSQPLGLLMMEAR